MVRRFSLLLWLFVLIFVQCSLHVCFAQTKPFWEVGQPIVHQNLVIFPVRILKPAHKTDFITLKEAQQKNLVSIRELPSATVSEVLVENKSDKPLLLIGGEVILGGKQDRIVEHDFIVPPKKIAKVKVYCVEPGRWVPQEQGEKFAPAMSVVAPEVRKSAQVEKSQQLVWHFNERVQAQIPAATPMSPSKSYRRVLTDAQVQKEVQAYIRAIQSQLLRDPKVCGIIVAVNGKIEWLDVFSDPSLFRKVSPSLLHSAAVQALAKRSRTGNFRVPTVAEAKTFLEQAQRTQKRVKELETEHLRRERLEAPSVVGFVTDVKTVGERKPEPALHMNAFRR
ncbi:MAG: ARPP-1 family domain-containing protein [Armatimonadota bacterium]